MRLIFRVKLLILLLALFVGPSQSYEEDVYIQYKLYFDQLNNSSSLDTISKFFTNRELEERQRSREYMKKRGYDEETIEETNWTILAIGGRFKEISDHVVKDYLGDSKCLVVRGLYYNDRWASTILKYDYENDEYKIDKVVIYYDDGGKHLFIHAKPSLCDELHGETVE